MEAQPINCDELKKWQETLFQNPYLSDLDFQHSVSHYFGDAKLDSDLTRFAHKVVTELEPLVQENHRPENLPRIEHYDGIGRSFEKVVHHPAYSAAGDAIYSSGLMEKMSQPGRLLEALTFMLLSSQAGEAGHNCPIACSAGMIRVFQKVADFPQKELYFQRLIKPSFQDNFTGAQFVTEVQGGSDVGTNQTHAYQDADGRWRIVGEKWFCSNANADLILMTARFDASLRGTRGLGLFLVPALQESGESNHYFFRRLKEKMGTKTLATAEMDFQGALAIPMGPLEEGFKLLMENVLHISRICNAFCVVGMARRAYHIAASYAQHRTAFDRPIMQFPLVRQKLLRIKVENTALMASIFGMARLQDHSDTEQTHDDASALLLRFLANVNKSLTALWSVRHIHHALDTLAGNGTIETFSPIPRLLQDCIICENWEGTHNILSQQVLRDIHRYHVDEIFLDHIESRPLEEPIFKEKVQEVRSNIAILKSSELELQSYQIQTLAWQMGILYAALQLKAETGSKPKQQCLNHFLQIYFNHRWELPRLDNNMADNFIL